MEILRNVQQGMAENCTRLNCIRPTRIIELTFYFIYFSYTSLYRTTSYLKYFYFTNLPQLPKLYKTSRLVNLFVILFIVLQLLNF